MPKESRFARHGIKRLREDLAHASSLGSEDEIGDSLYKSHGNATVANILQKRIGGGRSLIRPVPRGVSHRQAPPWKMAITGKAATAARIVHGLRGTEIFNDGPAIPKHEQLRFKVTTSVQPPCECHWQVVNTGDEATRAKGLQGDFYETDLELGRRSRKERTLYTGWHWVECFIVKNGVCVARTAEFFINIQCAITLIEAITSFVSRYKDAVAPSSIRLARFPHQHRLLAP